MLRKIAATNIFELGIRQRCHDSGLDRQRQGKKPGILREGGSAASLPAVFVGYFVEY
jgi:hypothetical protein